jgi:hypothetical protein
MAERNERNDTETQSYREEQGKSATPNQRERIGDVPLTTSSAGVVGGARRDEESTVEADRQAAERRAEADRGEVF